MSDKVELKTFPENRLEALALLYVQAQDLSGKTPAEVQTLYFQAYYEMKKDYREKYQSGWLKDQQKDV